MGFDHCVGHGCFPSSHNFPSNPVPKLNYPTKTHQSFSTVMETATDAVKELITTTFQTFAEKDVTVPVATEILTIPALPNNEKATTVQQAIDTVTQAIADVIDSNAADETVILNEDAFNNRSVIVGVTESINNTGIFETMNNGSASMNTDIITTMKNEENVNSLSDILTTTTEKVVSTVQTATEKVMDIFASTISAESHHDHGDDMENANHGVGSHNAIYIILGIIIVILLLMCVIIIVIYIRQRKSKSHSLMHHPYFNISPKKDNIPATSDQSQDKDCLNDVYVQYTC